MGAGLPTHCLCSKWILGPSNSLWQRKTRQWGKASKFPPWEGLAPLASSNPSFLTPNAHPALGPLAFGPPTLGSLQLLKAGKTSLFLLPPKISLELFSVLSGNKNKTKGELI